MAIRLREAQIGNNEVIYSISLEYLAQLVPNIVYGMRLDPDIYQKPGAD